MIVAIVLGLAIGLTLGALGGGGSILAVPVLVYVADQSPSAATTTSLVAVGVAAAVAAVTHARKGKVRWGAAAAFIATGVAGSWLGSQINAQINGDLLLLGFSALVLVAAYRMLTACPSCTNIGEERALAAEAAVTLTTKPAPTAAGHTHTASEIWPSTTPEPTDPRSAAGERARTIGKILIAGSVVGFLTGMFGVGGGFVIVPALTLALGLSLPMAIGTSLVVIVGNAAVSLGFRGLDAIDWSLAIPFTATMLVGSFLGSMLAHRIPVEKALHAFAGLLVVVAVGNGIAASIALAT